MTAARVRHRLVDDLRTAGRVRTASVEGALRAVPRHLFLPGVAVGDAYADEAVTVQRVDGVATSSASQPSMMAIMLEQLDVRPGHRVLEIGAGTGYNAALLAHLAGPTGAVTAIDIDVDLVAGAREHLRAADVGGVDVICADGALGYPPGAPYDRVIVTVGCPDVRPEWVRQLAPGGRLLLPLGLRGSQVSIALDLGPDGVLRSSSVRSCAFVRLRGVGAGADPTYPLPGTGWTLHPADPGLPVDPAALTAVLVAAGDARSAGGGASAAGGGASSAGGGASAAGGGASRGAGDGSGAAGDGVGSGVGAAGDRASRGLGDGAGAAGSGVGGGTSRGAGDGSGAAGDGADDGAGAGAGAEGDGAGRAASHRTDAASAPWAGTTPDPPPGPPPDPVTRPPGEPAHLPAGEPTPVRLTPDDLWDGFGFFLALTEPGACRLLRTTSRTAARTSSTSRTAAHHPADLGGAGALAPLAPRAGSPALIGREGLAAVCVLPDGATTVRGFGPDGAALAARLHVVVERWVAAGRPDAAGLTLAVRPRAAPGHGHTAAPGQGPATALGEGHTTAAGPDTAAAPGHGHTAAPGQGPATAAGPDTAAAPGQGPATALGEGHTTAAGQNPATAAGQNPTTAPSPAPTPGSGQVEVLTEHCRMLAGWAGPAG